MLVIGHHGSARINHQRKTSGVNSAFDPDADMIKVDIRLTRDGIPIVGQNFPMNRTRHKLDRITQLTLSELSKQTAGSDRPVVTFVTALKKTLGNAILIIDVEEYRAVMPALKVLKPHIKHEADWELVMFSSFNPLILRKIRSHAPDAALALLHHRNPLNFIAWQIPLRLTAVGFHRLHLSNFGLKVAQKLGLFTYVYTVNRLAAAKILEEKGYDGVVTDYPTQFVKDLQK